MIKLKTGLKSPLTFSMALLLVLGPLALAGAANQPPTNRVPSQAHAADSTPAPSTTGSQTNQEPDTPHLSLQPWNNFRSWGLFASTVMTDETGQAFVLLPGGLEYMGGVRNGQPEGQGTMSSINGIHQWGEFRNGQSYKLTGRWVSPDGTIEEGSWNLDGTPSGGTITWKDGRVYKGPWRLMAGAPEAPDGTGTMTWPDGRVYVGEFRNGKMEGKGKMLYRSGRIENGIWKDNQFIGPAP